MCNIFLFAVDMTTCPVPTFANPWLWLSRQQEAFHVSQWTLTPIQSWSVSEASPWKVFIATVSACLLCFCTHWLSFRFFLIHFISRSLPPKITLTHRHSLLCRCTPYQTPSLPLLFTHSYIHAINYLLSFAWINNSFIITRTSQTH